MSKVLSNVFFLSRFPRFATPVESLLRMEESYTLIHRDDLPAAIAAVDTSRPAPRSYEDFMAAARADVPAWPALYVHRYNVKNPALPAVIRAHHAREHAQYVGTLREVGARLASGEGLNRYHRGSNGGRNRFDVPPL